MQRTSGPLPGPLTRLTACGLVAVGALLWPVSALAAPLTTGGLFAVTSAPADIPRVRLLSLEAPTDLSSQLTDDLGVLRSSSVSKVTDRLESGYGLRLWVATYSDSSSTAEEHQAAVWEASGLGSQDALLLINMPDGVGNGGSYSFARGEDGPVTDAQYEKIQSGIQSALSDGDYDGAVQAVLDGMETSSGSGTRSSVAPVLGATAAGGGLIALGVYSSRRRRNGSASAGAGGPRQEPVIPLEQLRTQAGSVLVTTDDAVRAAGEELSYAQAQFGLSATDAFTQALTTARGHVERSFELRKLLDDSVPETEPQQRQMYGEIIQRCNEAVAAIRAQEESFSQRRGIEASLPASIAETSQRAQETQQTIAMANTLLVTLHATYPASALTSVSDAPQRAKRLLDAGRTALDQAQASAQAGQQSTAVEQVRIAQGSIAQAGQLASQVMSARERLARASTDLAAAIASISSDLTDAQRLGPQVPAATLEPLVADAEAAVAQGRAASGLNATGDPLAALEHLSRAEAAIDAGLAQARTQEENDSRARSALGSRLERLNAQVTSVTSYITAHRGAVGSSARTALSEAARHAAAATSLQPSDPQSALAEVAAAEPLVAQAQALAEADVSNSSGTFGGPSTGGGIDLGSLVLGGILLGGGQGGYGGWGGSSWDDGPFGRGGLGGGGFDGGGGGFGGGFDGGGGSF